MDRYPDCDTARENELYEALMLLGSAVSSRRSEWKNWEQGGTLVKPVIYKALRLED